MAETFTFSEGTAYVVTGNATSTGMFVTNIRGSYNYEYYSYRPPLSTTYTYIETRKYADVNISQMYSQKELATMFNGATAGGVHVKLVHAAAGITGTITLFSGVLDNHSIAGSEGGVMTRDIRGRFQNWSET